MDANNRSLAVDDDEGDVAASADAAMGGGQRPDDKVAVGSIHVAGKPQDSKQGQKSGKDALDSFEDRLRRKIKKEIEVGKQIPSPSSPSSAVAVGAVHAATEHSSKTKMRGSFEDRIERKMNKGRDTDSKEESLNMGRVEQIGGNERPTFTPEIDRRGSFEDRIQRKMNKGRDTDNKEESLNMGRVEQIGGNEHPTFTPEISAVDKDEKYKSVVKQKLNDYCGASHVESKPQDSEEGVKSGIKTNTAASFEDLINRKLKAGLDEDDKAISRSPPPASVAPHSYTGSDLSFQMMQCEEEQDYSHIKTIPTSNIQKSDDEVTEDKSLTQLSDHRSPDDEVLQLMDINESQKDSILMSDMEEGESSLPIIPEAFLVSERDIVIDAFAEPLLIVPWYKRRSTKILILLLTAVAILALILGVLLSNNPTPTPMPSSSPTYSSWPSSSPTTCAYKISQTNVTIDLKINDPLLPVAAVDGSQMVVVVTDWRASLRNTVYTIFLSLASDGSWVIKHAKNEGDSISHYDVALSGNTALVQIDDELTVYELNRFGFWEEIDEPFVGSALIDETPPPAQETQGIISSDDYANIDCGLACIVESFDIDGDLACIVESNNFPYPGDRYHVLTYQRDAHLRLDSGQKWVKIDQQPGYECSISDSTIAISNFDDILGHTVHLYKHNGDSGEIVEFQDISSTDALSVRLSYGHLILWDSKNEENDETLSKHIDIYQETANKTFTHLQILNISTPQVEIDRDILVARGENVTYFYSNRLNNQWEEIIDLEHTSSQLLAFSGRSLINSVDSYVYAYNLETCAPVGTQTPSLSPAPSQTCFLVLVAVELSTSPGPRNPTIYDEKPSWYLRRTDPDGNFRLASYTYKRSDYLDEISHNESLCLEQGEYEFNSEDSFKYRHSYEIKTEDGTLLAKGGGLGRKVSSKFSILFVDSPSSMPSFSVAPSSSTTPTVFPSSSTPPTTTQVPSPLPTTESPTYSITSWPTYEDSIGTDIPTPIVSTDPSAVPSLSGAPSSSATPTVLPSSSVSPTITPEPSIPTTTRVHSLWVWGAMDSIGEETGDSIVPTDVDELVVDVSAGTDYTLFIFSDQTAAAAGYVADPVQYQGHFALGDQELSLGANSISRIKNIINLNGNIVEAPAWTNVYAGVESSEGSGRLHSLFISTDGVAYAAGSNNRGELCVGDTRSRSFPTEIALPDNEKAVGAAVGGEFTLILTARGNLYGCGSNKLGQLGLSQVNNVDRPELILEGGAVESVSVGQHFSLVKTFDQLLVMGDNTFGQLCTDSGGDPITSPSALALDAKSVRSFVASKESAYVLFNDGSAGACGLNDAGQLGDGFLSDRITTMVEFPGSVSEMVYVGSGPSAQSVFWISADGVIYANGLNDRGQLGTGDTSDRAVPVVVKFPSNTEVYAFSASNSHTVAQAV